MRQGLLLAVLLTTITICLASSVVHKEIHPDGSKGEAFLAKLDIYQKFVCKLCLYY
uniref:Venom peptide n=1 Tax=Ascaris lumbricoides TaxID=6252 RepID=A0A0M3IU47_ASCLU